MRVLRARLVHPSRVKDLLARADEPLPEVHERLLAWVLPGQLQERFLVVDLDGAAAGDVAVLSVYPVLQGGLVDIVAPTRGRCRVAARLAPVVSGLGILTADIEHGDEELWSDELQVERADMRAFAEEIAQRIARARAAANVLELPGPHGLQVMVEPERLIAQFRCSAPAFIVARTPPGGFYLQLLDWPGPVHWSTDSTMGAEQLPEAVRAAIAHLLGQSVLGEVRLDAWRGRVALVMPGLDLVRAEALVREVADMVGALPVPAGDPPPGPAWPSVREIVAEPRPAKQIARAGVLELERAKRLLETPDVELPLRHDPVHAPWLDAPIAPRALLLDFLLLPEPSVWRLRSDPPTFRGHEVRVPAGEGRWRTLVPIEMDLWKEGVLEIEIESPRGWWVEQVRVPMGRSATVLLRELAERIPGAQHGSDGTVRVRLPGAPRVTFGASFDVGARPAQEWNPLRTLGWLVLGTRFAAVAGDVDGEAGGTLRELRATVDLPFAEAASLDLGRQGMRAEAEDGRLVLVADVTGADIGRLDYVARAMIATIADSQ